MPCKHNTNKLYEFTDKLPGDNNERSFLVALEYLKPKTIFGWPLFAFRNRFISHAKVYFSEIEVITWNKTNSGWKVKLVKGEISGLDNIDSFIELKNEFYKNINS